MKIPFFIFYVSVARSQKNEIDNSNALFTADLYKERVKTGEDNFLLSPYSTKRILAFELLGARGSTGDEIRKALHLLDDQDQVESELKSLLAKIEDSGALTLNTAAKIYVKENFVIRKEFKESASRIYGADVESVDFKKNVETANSINSWIENRTNNKVTNLIDSDDLDEYTRVVLLSALYFQAGWLSPFPSVNTQKKNFYKTPTDVVQVDTMQHFEIYFDYYESSELEADLAKLYFQGALVSMVIVLPKERDGLEKLEQRLDRVFDLGYPMIPTYLNVALPKFRIESSVDLKPALQNLGIRSAFDEKSADLSGIAGNKGDLFVDKIKEKTFLDVSEGGVEAAAVNYVVNHAPKVLNSFDRPTPRDFIADHPFIFYVQINDFILFAGRVTDPEA